MELTTPTKKVTIHDCGHELVHTMRRFKGNEFINYKRQMTQKVLRRGGTSINADTGTLEVKWWMKMVESVEGYKHNGEDVSSKENWKELVVELAPEHCLQAFGALTNIFVSDESKMESSDDGPDVPFQDDSSEDASDDD